MNFKGIVGLACAALISVLSAGHAVGQEKTVKIGAVLPLSGNAASAGGQTKAAIELAIQDGTIQHIRRVVERIEK